jgi:hypothetical protein
MPQNFKFLISVDRISKDHGVFTSKLSSSTPFSHDSKEKKEFQNNLGIKRWRLWIQKGEGENNYCVQYIELNQEIKFLDSFQQAILNQNPFASWLDGIFKSSLSLEYSLSHNFLDVQRKIDEICLNTPHEYFEVSYLLPLLERKMSESKETYHYINQHGRNEIIQTYRSIKMNQARHYIQTTGKDDYILINTEHHTSPLEGRIEVLSKKEALPSFLTKSIESQSFTYGTFLPEADYIAIFGN